MEWIFQPETWMALVTLTAIEIVLGIDNIVFLSIMVAAIIVAVVFMMILSGAIIRFVERHPTIKMLALSFLLLIGIALVGDGFSMHIPRGYIYFAMAFSVFVEILNMKLRKGEPVPVHLRKIPREQAADRSMK